MHCVQANDVIGFLLLTCCTDLSTRDQLIIRRKYPNAPESGSELFTGDTSESIMLVTYFVNFR